MWRTPLGNRVLTGVEADVFVEGVRSLAAELRDQRDEHDSEVPTFDGLSFGQRVATLQFIADALLHADIPVPEHTAANEAAIDAVYRRLHQQVVEELVACDEGMVECKEFRMLLLRAAAELEEGDTLSLESDEAEWREFLGVLSSRVLWDRDFELEGLYLDAVDEPTGEDGLGVVARYFAAIPEDPSDEVSMGILTRLMKT